MSPLSSKSAFVIAALCGFAGLLSGAPRAEAQEQVCLARYAQCEQRCLQASSSTSAMRCHYNVCRPRLNRCIEASLLYSQPVAAVALASRVYFPHDRPGPGRPPSKPPTPPPGAGNGNGGIVPPHLPRGGIVPTGHNAPSPGEK